VSHAPAGNRPAFPPRTKVAPAASVLVLFCHPVAERSRVNRALLHAISGVPGVTVHDLYEAYPDFAIDVPYEQELLLAHDVVVMQHPFYWYSTPALLKEWQDHVLAFGWAYGKGGTKLRGKKLLTAVTTGGPDFAYRDGGMHGVTVRQLLAPIAATARLCGMTYLPPFVTHGTHRLNDEGVVRAADAYRAVVSALASGRLHAVAAADGSLDVERSVPVGGVA
jgi:glutathione-regulated potassium-efflux system ancillary protein KefG